jgi:hypothetical protein
LGRNQKGEDFPRSELELDLSWILTRALGLTGLGCRISKLGKAPGLLVGFTRRRMVLGQAAVGKIGQGGAGHAGRKMKENGKGKWADWISAWKGFGVLKNLFFFPRLIQLLNGFKFK